MGQPLLNVLYSIIPITIILYIIPFKDILARGMVASGAASPLRFYIVLFLLQKYLIQLFLRTFWQGAWWHLGQPLLNVFI